MSPSTPTGSPRSGSLKQQPSTPPKTRVHPTADIEPDVEIGAGTSIWHRAHVRSGARLGSDCVIGGQVYIDVDVTIGDRCKIQSAALIYHGAEIRDGVFVGPGAIITNDRNPRAEAFGGGLASEADWTVSPVLLEQGCSIGAGAIIVAGVTVGAYALVAAGAVVIHDVPAFTAVAGVPAKPIGRVCKCGRRLQSGQCPAHSPSSR